MEIKIISTAFSTLSLLDINRKIHCIGRKWIFISDKVPPFWVQMPNKPNPFLRFTVKNYSFGLNNSLDPIDINYHKELDDIHDCNFFKFKSKIFLIGWNRIKNSITETYMFSYPKIIEKGKIKSRHNIPPFQNRNLSFFGCENKIFVLYTINPLIVLQMSEDMQTFQVQKELSYNTPNVHGGTSLISYNKNEFLGVCHHYHTFDRARFYSIYCYTLSKSFPFKILRFSSPLIDSKSIPSDLKCPSWCSWMDTEKSKVVFERGLIEYENKIMIGFGIQDKISAIAILNKNELENKLSPIDYKSNRNFYIRDKSYITKGNIK